MSSGPFVHDVISFWNGASPDLERKGTLQITNRCSWVGPPPVVCSFLLLGCGVVLVWSRFCWFGSLFACGAPPVWLAHPPRFSFFFGFQARRPVITFWRISVSPLSSQYLLNSMLIAPLGKTKALTGSHVEAEIG